MGASSLDDFVKKLDKPRADLADGAGGRRRPDASTTWCRASRRATSSSTAATRTTSTTSAARRSSKAKGIHYVDVGTSGGVWGLERGYCLMIGGETAVVKHLDPIFATLAPGDRATSPRTPGREKLGGTAEHGYLHCGPSGAGHFVKMVHNGIEYGIMAAYAEGLDILRHANVGKQTHDDRRRDDAAARSRALPVRPQPARRRRGLAAGQRDRLVAARPDGDGPAQGPRAVGLRGPRLRLGRGALDDQGGDRRGGAGAGAHHGALRALQLARRGRLRGQAALGDALRSSAATSRKPPASEPPADSRAIPGERWRSQSDALVFFGATGDLAYKKIFPALQAMVKRGHLDVPVIGVAKAGWDLDQLKARARDSLEKHGGVDEAAFAKLCGLLRYVDGDYKDPATFQALRKELGDGPAPGPLPGHPARAVRDGRRTAGQVGLRRGARVIVEKPFGSDLDSAQALNKILLEQLRRVGDLPHRPLPRASGRCRTCSSSASPTRSSSRSGTATTSRACRSRWRRTSASRAAAPSTTRPARSATWSRTTCSRSWPTWRWSPRPRRTASRSATRRSRSSRRSRRSTRRTSCAASSAATATRRAWRPIPRSRRSPPCGWRSIPGAGRGCPFFIRAGKCLPVTCTEVLVKLRRPPTPSSSLPPGPNYFRFRISPEASIAIGVMVMGSGEEMAGEPVELLASHHPDADEMDAYERLLGEAMKGDATLFAREDYVEEAWRIVEPVLGSATPMHEYEPNTWGPSQADRIITGAGGWHDPVMP